MAITNPDSLLDKNGLAYYHSKVKQQITASREATVNVTQSEHQRIGYSIDPSTYVKSVAEVQRGPIAYNSNWEEWIEGYIENGSFVDGSNVRIYFAPEDGYSCGNLVLNLDGIALIEGEDYEVNHWYQAGKYNYYVVDIFVAYGGVLTISATPATVSTVEYDITFNYDIPEGSSVRIVFNLPNGETSTYNFTGTGTRTISLPEGTTYDSSMPDVYSYSTTPSNGRISGTVSQDTEITFGYTPTQYSYYVDFRDVSGSAISTTYKVYVDGTLVESGSGSTVTVNGYYGEPFRVEIDPIQGYTTSRPTVTGTLGSGSQMTVRFTPSGGPGDLDDPETPL